MDVGAMLLAEEAPCSAAEASCTSVTLVALDVDAGRVFVDAVEVPLNVFVERLLIGAVGIACDISP